MKWVNAMGHSLQPCEKQGWSILTIRLMTPQDKLDGIIKLLKGKFNLVLKRYEKPRSLNANAYAWVLMDKIAKALNITKEEVYSRAIKQVGVFDTVSIDIAAYERFKQNWERHGLGWLVDRMMDDGVKVHLIAYYGSSVYSSSQMARLIDWIVEEAKSQGIDTMTPAERARLIDEWGKGNGNQEGK